jgi:hypothetical protein
MSKRSYSRIFAPAYERAERLYERALHERLVWIRDSRFRVAGSKAAGKTPSAPTAGCDRVPVGTNERLRGAAVTAEGLGGES